MTAPVPSRWSLRWTPLAAVLFVTGALLIVGGVALRSPVPLFLALPLLLAGPAAALGGPRGPARTVVTREATGSAMDVVVRTRVVTVERSDPRDLEIESPVPPGLHIIAPPDLRRTASSLDLETHWKAEEPTIVAVPPPRIVWRDAAGLVERPAEFEAPPLVVERYPPELLRVGAVRLHRTVALPGETRSHRIGSGGEFYGLRQAAPDDPYRHINWRASARAGRLLANDYQLDRAGDILLLLDARGSSLGPRIDERLLAISRAAAAGIAQSFLREKARVGVAVFSEFLDTVPLSTGRTQQFRVRSCLLDARLGPEKVPSERGAVAVSRYFPPGTTTLLFTPLADDTTGELVVHLHRRGYPVVVLSPSPLPLLRADTTLSAEDEKIIDRIAVLLRRSRIAKGWEDAPTIDWADYWSLAAFVAFLGRPAIRRAG